MRGCGGAGLTRGELDSQIECFICASFFRAATSSAHTATQLFGSGGLQKKNARQPKQLQATSFVYNSTISPLDTQTSVHKSRRGWPGLDDTAVATP